MEVENMKCAKCGHDVPANSPTCPWCAAGFKNAPPPPPQNNRAACPNCGSADISAVRRTYSPGCGCLGLMLFGWIGLLMGLLGAGDIDLVCRNCGTRWEAGNPANRRGAGCFIILLIIVLIMLLAAL